MKITVKVEPIDFPGSDGREVELYAIRIKDHEEYLFQESIAGPVEEYRTEPDPNDKKKKKRITRAVADIWVSLADVKENGIGYNTLKHSFEGHVYRFDNTSQVRLYMAAESKERSPFLILGGGGIKLTTGKVQEVPELYEQVKIVEAVAQHIKAGHQFIYPNLDACTGLEFEIYI